MPDFNWKGIQNKKYLSGVLSALTRDEAVYKLKLDGIIITQLDVVDSAKNKTKSSWEFDVSKFFANKKKIKPVLVMMATKKLSTMLRSGLSILPSLAMVRDQTENKKLKDIFVDIYQRIESGSNLSNAFANHPEEFNKVFVNLLRAGESSGRLDIFLDKLVESLKKSIKIRKNIISAMMYPMILLIVAVLVVGIMMIFVVPVFAEMFGSIGSQLPAPTLAVMKLSDFLRDPMGGGVLLVMIVIAFLVAKTIIRRNFPIRKKWHQFLLKLPLVGNMILNSSLAQIAMVYGNLTSAGVPVIEALDIAAESTNNEVLKEAILIAKRGVFSGEPLSQLLAKIDVIPPTFSQLISVGEQTGNMTEMLETISDYFEEEFDTSVDKLSQMMEPIMIVFLGGVIGFILIAMYLPIFKMGQVVMGN